jgi:hypothetical protein
MEGASNVSINNPTTNRQICAKMRTKCIEQGRLTALRAEKDELATECPYGHHLHRVTSD